MLKRAISSIALGLAVAFAAAPAEAGKREGVLKFAYNQVPENIDSYFNNVRIGVILSHHIWDQLIYRDPDSNDYKPSLATGWRWIDDKTLEFDLRRGVKFHNGEPFDADDVVYTLNFVSKPENKVVTQNNVNWIASAEKVDAYKVRINLKQPFPAALEYLAGPVVIYPNEYYAKVGPKGMNEKPVGSGPYMVTEHQPGRLVRLERNKEYFKDSPRPQPTIDKIELRLIPDVNTQMAELIAGGLDFIMHISPDQAQQLKAVPHLNVIAGETMRIVFLHMNSLDKAPVAAFKDKRVRQAIAHAIDRQAMLKAVVGEGARVLHTNCFPSQFGCTDEGATRYDYNPAKAKQLLAEAGFPNGFEFDFYAYRERHQTEAMIGYLRAVGIKANLRYMQYAAMRDAIRKGDVPLAHQTWGSFSVNDVSASTPVYWKFLDDDVTRDPQVRDWLETGDTSVDPKARKEAYAKALKKIADEAYSVPLYSLPVSYATSKELDFKPYPDEIPRFWEAKWK
ncbi:MAG TPA: ABC transporter substrate-binding protein [Alphaproteobacteria bacterium]|nr:ABC transporter substrate-binding protein [Alphaproteobacteria bacterium]